MRTVTLIRHAHSVANVTEAPASMPAEDLAFANRSAGLTERGENECRHLAPQLPIRYGINPSETPVAVSTFERPKLTAVRLGFVTIRAYSELDEVDYGMNLEELRAQLRENLIPRVAIEAARATLAQAPDEDVWITHALLIGGICIELGIVDRY